MSSDYNYMSHAKQFLRAHGWREEFTRPNGFRVDAFWTHPKHSPEVPLMQKAAVQVQKESTLRQSEQ